MTVPLSERAFLQQVLQLARLHGWRCAHFRPARTARGWRTAVQGDGKGFFDLVLVKGQRLIFAELKTDRGRLSPEQWAWFQAMKFQPAAVYLWCPRDWERIVGVLGGSE